MITKIDDVHTLTYSNDQLHIGAIHADIMKLRMSGVKLEHAVVKLNEKQLWAIVNTLPFFHIDSKHRGYYFHGVKAIIE